MNEDNQELDWKRPVIIVLPISPTLAQAALKTLRATQAVAEGLGCIVHSSSRSLPFLLRLMPLLLQVLIAVLTLIKLLGIKA